MYESHTHPHTSTLSHSDLVSGLIALMNSNHSLPVNLGNPEEHTITEFAQIIIDLIGNYGNNGMDQLSLLCVYRWREDGDEATQPR